jgi:4-hydroxybenzoate polyprenyltransferase
MSAALLKPLLTRFPRLPDFIALARLDRPIGIWLLLWPTLWAVYIAGNGMPSARILIIFTLGVVLMRSAGCVINDWADRHVDGQVQRTKDRPIVSGKVRANEALVLFVALVAAAAALLPFLNKATFYWSFGAIGLATLYPFMKRFTHLPQVVLGAAFSWSIPMAFVAQGETPGPACWLLYAANLCWTVAYDTQYAMADREDDLQGRHQIHGHPI